MWGVLVVCVPYRLGLTFDLFFFFFFLKVHFLTIPFTTSVLTMLTEVHNDLKQLKTITLWLKENVIH